MSRSTYDSGATRDGPLPSDEAPPDHPTEPVDAATIDPAEPPGCQAGVGDRGTAGPLRGMPQTLGRFRVVEFLGEGTFGAVFRAHDPQLDREVALKLAKATAQSADRLDRFRREARASARLRHPHIVPLFEAGEIGGQAFLASAFIPGTTLEDALHTQQQSGRFTPREAAEIGRKLAEALAYAHGQGVVHRDVKSANVILDPQGEPHLLDFGLALRDDGGDRMTQEGAFLGTPAYLAPEVVEGDRTKWGPATDQYALGVVLYELLTGRTPFSGPLDIVIYLHRTREPDRPSRTSPAVSRDLEAVCLKCLEKDPSHRYPSCQAVADDLRRYLDGRSTAARPLTLGERLVRWARRNPAPAALAATILLFVIAIVGAAFAFQRQQLTNQIALEASDRRARAEAAVEALATTEPVGVPLVLLAIQRVPAEAEPLLREKMAAAAPASRERSRYAMGLLPADPTLADEVLSHLPRALPEEVTLIAGVLRRQADRVLGALWSKLTSGQLTAFEQLRVAGVLAQYQPDEDRWPQLAPGLVSELSNEKNPVDLAAWSEILQPVREPFFPHLLENYRHAHHQLRSGELDNRLIVATNTKFENLARLAEEFASGQPEFLAELLMSADSIHYPRYFQMARQSRPAVIDALRRGLASETQSKPGAPAGVRPSTSTAVHQAYAAAALIAFGDGDGWPTLRFTVNPTARSYVIHAAPRRGVEPDAIVRRYRVEPDVSAHRALLLALGEFDLTTTTAIRDSEFAAGLLSEYRDHPDPGLHSAIDWLLRVRWGHADKIAEVDREMQGTPANRRRWMINSQGQTLVMVSGPVEFHLGAGPGESSRKFDANRHRVRIRRSFAVGTKEVTLEEFRRFSAEHKPNPGVVPSAQCPATELNWSDAAAYCNWLSKHEKLPPDQLCYLFDAQGNVRLAADYLNRTGYRLATEAEWEYAARSGTDSSRYFGTADDLLGSYAYYGKSSEGRLWPVGTLKPNDIGLFDVLGNAAEWVLDEVTEAYLPGNAVVVDKEKDFEITDQRSRGYRGGTYYDLAPDVRSARRWAAEPSTRATEIGFRIARTLPDAAP